MKIDISKLLDGTKELIELDSAITIQNIEMAESGIKITNPVKISGGIYSTEDGIFLNAQIIYNYVGNCARCLKEISKKAETNFSARIVDKRDGEQTEDEDELIIYHERNKVYLDDLIVTTILLSLPMKTLCKDDCKGLCSMCGKDLNEGQCDCIIENLDPRLAKLKELFD